VIPRFHDKQYLIGGTLILLGVTILAIFSPGTPAEYTAGDTSSDASVSGYDLFESGADTLANQLAAANRQEAENRFGRRYLSESYLSCIDVTFVCGDDEEYFFDPYGCGCEKLDFSPEDETEESEPEGEAFQVQYGEPMRIRDIDSIALNGGDALWIRSFNTDEAPPTITFDVYISGEDVTYQYPEEQDKVLYTIDLVASDYLSYADVVVTKPEFGGLGGPAPTDTEVFLE